MATDAWSPTVGTLYSTHVAAVQLVHMTGEVWQLVRATRLATPGARPLSTSSERQSSNETAAGTHKRSLMARTLYAHRESESSGSDDPRGGARDPADRAAGAGRCIFLCLANEREKIERYFRALSVPTERACTSTHLCGVCDL